MSPQAAFQAPISSITTSKGPSRSRTAASSPVRPVSPEKKRRRSSVAITQDDQRVALRSLSPRPEKCWAGVAVKETVPPGPVSVCCSHQSSSVMRRGSTPNCSRWPPTPSEVTMGTRSSASWRTLDAHR